MTWKSSRPAKSNSRPAPTLVCWGCLAWIAVAATATTLRGQSPTPGPSRLPPVAHIRFWNLSPVPAARPALAAAGGDLQLLPGEGQAALVSAGSLSFPVNYVPVRPGAYTLIVRRSGVDPAAGTLARLPANLRPEAYVTVLVSERDGRPVAELVDDTPDPKAPANAPGQLTVRQLMPGFRVNVTADRNTSSGELPYGQSRTLEALPPRLVSLFMLAQPAAAGSTPAPPRTWNAEVDFSGPSRRATLFIVGDAYGRFRPRVAMDGPVTRETPDASTTTSPPPAPPR